MPNLFGACETDLTVRKYTAKTKYKSQKNGIVAEFTHASGEVCVHPC